MIHGWGGGPDKDWTPWVKEQLEKNGYEVLVPLMPDTDVPKIKSWVSKLKRLVGTVRNSDIFIGHSIGCQTILRFLGQLDGDEQVDKVILIAPWMTLTNLENEEAWRIADPWLKTPIAFSKVRSKARSFVCIFSGNDAWVPLKKNSNRFRQELSPTIKVLSNRGHFSQEEGAIELPELLKTI